MAVQGLTLFKVFVCVTSLKALYTWLQAFFGALPTLHASVLYIEVLKLRCLVITLPHGVVVSIVDSGAAGPDSNPGGGKSVFTV